MRLRFREAGIKRLEVVASGKISAETHLLKEKEEHLKEIEVLRGQVDRNQEVTRFAMENLQLKEEIRRLKSFYEEGEREIMNEQIMVLQNKLLEALDWKLMHESDPSIVQKTSSEVVMEEVQGDGNLLINQELGSPWKSSINEENEFLRMQAIQNQAEMDALRKELEFCIDEKEKLERHVNDLVAKLEEERTFRAMKEEIQQVELPSFSTDVPNINLSDQMELKTMVDAIAAASQREAEAHETAIMLSRENDEMRMKLKVLIEDNNKLIELYERAAAESNYRSTTKAESAEDGTEVHQSVGFIEIAKEKEIEMKKVVENLEHQLMEMNEENEKLLGLYERAMQERDELKRLLSSCGNRRVETKVEFDCPEKLVEVDGQEPIDSGEPLMTSNLVDGGHAFEKPTIYGEVEVPLAENGFPGFNGQLEFGQCLGHSQLMKGNQTDCQGDSYLESDESPCFVGAKISVEESTELVEPLKETGVSGPHPADCQADSANQVDVGNLSDMEIDPSNLNAVKLSEDLNLIRMKLERVDEQLLDSAKSITKFGSLEKAIVEVDKLSREIEEMEDGVKDKQQQFESLKLTTSNMKERRALIDKKLLALKNSLSSFSSSVVYFEQREARAKSRAIASTSYLDRKKEELTRLQAQKDEIETMRRKIQQSEVELRNNLACLKSKLEEENQKREHEKVLFAIDNVEKIDPSQKNWHLGGKATDLLKSEEEKTKLQTEMKLSREKLGAIRTELEGLNKKYGKVESEMQAVEAEIQKGLRSAEEMEVALQGAVQEKETLLEIRENGKTEIESLILEYQQRVFEADLKEAEMNIVEEELRMELRRKDELQMARSIAVEETTRLFEDTRCHSCCLSEKMGEELQTIRASLLEAKLLLRGSIDS